MAKIEVACVTPGWNISGVALQRYNAAGYCAPSGVYGFGDYSWPDYVGTLHLVGDRNDAEPKSLDFAPSAQGTFVAYVPEYRNLAGGTTGVRAQDAAELRVTFRESGDNYYYKFTITKAAEPLIVVDVYPYEEVELDPGFGLLSASKNEKRNEK